MKPTPIFLIERHPPMRASILSAIGSDPDFEVLPAGTVDENSLVIRWSGGQQVYFPVKKPAIVILGIGNPGKEDLEAVKTLHAKWPDLALLALTSSEVPGQEQQAIACGSKAVLPKTSSRSELVKALIWMKNEFVSGWG
jgi:DNA-binding NarL/FixJ family response regulator